MGLDMNQHIQICLVGSFQEEVPGGVIVVESDLDYVKACKALRSGGCSVIWSRTRVHFEWLKAYTELLAVDAQYVEMTPKLLLADAWQVDIPDWLTDDDVQEQKILKIDIPAAHPHDFARTALAALLGDAFICDKLTEESLIRIVQALTAPSAPEIHNRYPLLKACLQDCCERWDKATQTPWSEMACEQLQKNPDHLRRDLTYLVLLGGYPKKLLEFKVSLQLAQALREMDRSVLRKMQPHPLAITDAIEQIDLFFRDVGHKINTETDFVKVLNCTSGLLPREFDLLREILSSGIFQASKNIVKKMQEHFAPGRAVSKVKLELLNNLVVPLRPKTSQDTVNWGWSEWMSWILDEYLPYRRWQQSSGTFDPEVETIVGRFSDWYVSSYESIHADHQRSIVHVFSALREQIQQDEVSLVFIVDCLPLAFLPQLSTAFISAGFHQHDLRSVCALLPSVTDVCKLRLITGEWETTSAPYEKAFKRRGEQSWPNKSVKYFGADLNALRDSGPFQEPSVLMLNYLSGDETLHSDVVAAGSTYEEELHRIYSRLANAAKEVFERSGINADTFGVYIVTDHGATKILPEETDNIDSVVVRKLFPDEKHRSAKIDDSDVDSIPSNLWEFGYRFKQPFVESKETYFIPRGHNTIRAGTPKGYVHGGAAPEEVVVPVVTWRPVSVPWKPPASRFLELNVDPGTKKATFYVRRMSKLRLELQNPNTKPIEIGQISVFEPAADVRDALHGVVPPGKTLVVEFECSFDRAALTADELAVRINYSIEGSQQVADCRTAAIFKSAMTGGFNLRDL